MRRLIHTTRATHSSLKDVLKPSKRSGSLISRWHRSPTSAVADEGIVAAAQELRGSLAANADPLPALTNLISHAGDNAGKHVHLFRQALDRAAAMKPVPATVRQAVFRALAKGNSDPEIDLATQIYIQIWQNAALSPQDRLHNGLLFYSMLRHRGLIGEARRLVNGLMVDNASLVSPEELNRVVTELIDISAAVKPDAASLVTIIESLRGSVQMKTVQEVVGKLCDRSLGFGDNALKSMIQLVDHLAFANPHFDIDNTTYVVLLDAMVDLGVKGDTARKLLHRAAPRLSTGGRLEDLELLLLCCIRFGDGKELGDRLVNDIAKFDVKDRAKETWDTLTRWEVYRSAPTAAVTSLRRLVADMEAAGVEPDATTLSGVLEVASAEAQRSETEISAIVTLFSDELGVERDAASFATLISRALRAVEVERARLLFIDSTSSGADWTMDGGRHLPVLSELLVALCRTPSIDRRWVFDTYDRVHAYTPSLSYDAQVELLRQYLDTGDLSATSLFLVQQYSENPALSYDTYRGIYDAFYTKIMATNDFVQAWDFYGALNATVVLPYESYYPFQQRFCDIERPDAAHLMFRHLRNRAKSGEVAPPGREMYLMLFAQYTRFRYEEGIRELETYFRMDLNNDMDIDIMNSMLAAYLSLTESPKISNLWLETLSFPRGHGATDTTINIMLTHLTQQLSLEAVDDLWAEFPVRFGLKPSAENVRRYVIANCYHGYYMRALDIVKAAPQLYDVEITPKLLETVYNWSMVESRKAMVEQFATENFPEMWTQLKDSGSLRNHVLPPNPQHDSDASLRAATIALLEADEQRLPQFVGRTDDGL